MILLKKIWGSIKEYWYIAAIAVLTVVFLLLRKDNSHLIEILKFKLEKNKEETAKLNAVKQEKDEKQRKAEIQAEKELKRIQKEYDAAKDSLDEEKKQHIEKLLEKTPEELSDEVADLMGFKVVKIDED
jgi:flagellar biosynthesis/type III secretory pathway M-ring protein FliF/YscJ